ncbi:hypothetical protein JKP88DRAFT_348318 [Tribonema minus]|uniref:Uncharacterized protein n=1 Tax=Tribonema minus TaxID=303371 RepID=A0A836CJ10_9STRA|nr:hypothetical protein JKP88DRAFT_348318 [Tribonema minus]
MPAIAVALGVLLASSAVAANPPPLASVYNSSFWLGLESTPQDQLTDAVAEAGGNAVYISGYGSGIAAAGVPDPRGQDAFLRAYNATGGLLWSANYGGQYDDSAEGVALDGSGGVFIAGTLGGPPQEDGTGKNSSAFAARYDAATGARVWERTWGTDDTDGAAGVAVDAGEGLLYVVGSTQGSFGGDAAAPNGTDTDGASGIAVDAGEALLYVVNAGNADFFLSCLQASDGALLWTRQVGSFGPGVAAVGSSGYDVAVRVAVGPRGGVYVVGQMGTDNALESARAFLGRWDYLGNQQNALESACAFLGRWDYLGAQQESVRAFLGRWDYLGNQQFMVRLNSTATHYATAVAVEQQGPQIDDALMPDPTTAGTDAAAKTAIAAGAAAAGVKPAAEHGLGEGAVYMSGHTSGGDKPVQVFLAAFQGATGEQAWLTYFDGALAPPPTAPPTDAPSGPPSLPPATPQPSGNGTAAAATPQPTRNATQAGAGQAQQPPRQQRQQQQHLRHQQAQRHAQQAAPPPPLPQQLADWQMLQQQKLLHWQQQQQQQGVSSWYPPQQQQQPQQAQQPQLQQRSQQQQRQQQQDAAAPAAQDAPPTVAATVPGTEAPPPAATDAPPTGVTPSPQPTTPRPTRHTPKPTLPSATTTPTASGSAGGSAQGGGEAGTPPAVTAEPTAGGTAEATTAAPSTPAPTEVPPPPLVTMNLFAQQVAVVEPAVPYALSQVVVAGYRKSGGGGAAEMSQGFLLAADADGEWRWFQPLPRSARATALVALPRSARATALVAAGSGAVFIADCADGGAAFIAGSADGGAVFIAGSVADADADGGAVFIAGSVTDADVLPGESLFLDAGRVAPLMGPTPPPTPAPTAAQLTPAPTPLSTAAPTRYIMRVWRETDDALAPIYPPSSPTAAVTGGEGWVDESGVRGGTPSRGPNRTPSGGMWPRGARERGKRYRVLSAGRERGAAGAGGGAVSSVEMAHLDAYDGDGWNSDSSAEGGGRGRGAAASRRPAASAAQPRLPTQGSMPGEWL